MIRASGSVKIRAAHAFLVQADAEKRVFSFDEFVAGSGWAANTARANLSRKLSQHVVKVEGGYQPFGVKEVSEDAFCRLCSQNTSVSGNPFKPQLNPKVEQLVDKARDAALAAVQHYNDPTARFKSDTYIVLMVIACTALFHAVFERDSVDYTVKNPDGSPHLLAGETMLWDLQGCITHYEGGRSTPMAANINLIVPLRHKIEHRYIPPLDAKISGHCQSLLTNFETILIKEFTAYYSLNASLCPPLGFSAPRSPEAILAMRRFQTAEYDEISKFIDDYHRSLPDDIFADSEFAFRVFLIPKSANHARSSDISVEFIPLSECTAELLAEMDKRVVAIKTATREARNISYMLPREVCRRVSEAIGSKFGTNSHHVRAWKAHGVRPDGASEDKSKTDPKYCVYDSTFGTYVYTEAWVELLSSTYCDIDKFQAL